jgi:hypothetical protein
MADIPAHRAASPTRSIAPVAGGQRGYCLRVLQRLVRAVAATASPAAVALIVSVGLAGCAASEPREPGPSYTGAPQAVDLGGRLQQYREDEVAHRLVVLLTNHGPTTVRVETVRVDWPGLDGTEDAAPAYDIPPGVTVGLKAPYGEAVCDSAERPTDPVNAVVTTPDQEVVVPLAAEDLLLERLWDLDCRRQAVEAQVSVAFGPEWARETVAGAPVLRGSLVVERGEGDGRIDVVDLDGSVLLTLDAAQPAQPAQPLLRLEPDRSRGSLVVDVGAAGRCDGHSLGESKKTYVFDVGLDLGDGQGRVDLTLQPPDDVKALMWQMLTDACGV